MCITISDSETNWTELHVFYSSFQSQADIEEATEQDPSRPGSSNMALRPLHSSSSWTRPSARAVRAGAHWEWIGNELGLIGMNPFELKNRLEHVMRQTPPSIQPCTTQSIPLASPRQRANMFELRPMTSSWKSVVFLSTQ